MYGFFHEPGHGGIVPVTFVVWRWKKNQDGVRENPSNRREIPLYDREIPVKIVEIFFGLFSNSSQALYVD